MDHQQRVLLHTAYEALENAGHVPDTTPTFRRENIGCGSVRRDYVQNLGEDVDVFIELVNFGFGPATSSVNDD
jgi:acyl transferase domain-containing protein